jgi:hypothetical protein
VTVKQGQGCAGCGDDKGFSGVLMGTLLPVVDEVLHQTAGVSDGRPVNTDTDMHAIDIVRGGGSCSS